ncbi:hypothetical protein, partial [Salmonella enterica]|uniref:hypothetical protein n=1 Tax=Salmonella enterica TaxID=28901 RepID=UPI0020C46E42
SQVGVEKTDFEGKSKDMGSDGNKDSGDSKRSMENELTTSNRFNVLADEIIEEGSKEWVEMKHSL